MLSGSDHSPSPDVACAIGCVLGGIHVLVPGVNEGPNLIALVTIRLDIAHRSVVEVGTRAARVAQQLGDRIPVDIEHASRASHGVSLDQHGEDRSTLFDGK